MRALVFGSFFLLIKMGSFLYIKIRAFGP
jgi:hypothetical protein